MQMINENALAKTVVKREGKKVQVNIAQAKEVIRIVLEELSKEYLPSEIMALMEKHNGKYW